MKRFDVSKMDFTKATSCTNYAKMVRDTWVMDKLNKRRFVKKFTQYWDGTYYAPDGVAWGDEANKSGEGTGWHVPPGFEFYLPMLLSSFDEENETYDFTKLKDSEVPYRTAWQFERVYQLARLLRLDKSLLKKTGRDVEKLAKPSHRDWVQILEDIYRWENSIEGVWLKWSFDDIDLPSMDDAEKLVVIDKLEEILEPYRYDKVTGEFRFRWQTIPVDTGEVNDFGDTIYVNKSFISARVADDMPDPIDGEEPVQQTYSEVAFPTSLVDAPSNVDTVVDDPLIYSILELFMKNEGVIEQARGDNLVDINNSNGTWKTSNIVRANVEISFKLSDPDILDALDYLLFNKITYIEGNSPEEYYPPVLGNPLLVLQILDILGHDVAELSPHLGYVINNSANPNLSNGIDLTVLDSQVAYWAITNLLTSSSRVDKGGKFEQFLGIIVSIVITIIVAIVIKGPGVKLGPVIANALLVSLGLQGLFRLIFDADVDPEAEEDEDATLTVGECNDMMGMEAWYPQAQINTFIQQDTPQAMLG